MSTKPHDVGVTDLGDGFSDVRCHQSKFHRTVPTERVSSEINCLDDACETEHCRVDFEA
jgi:hypothetical protein